MTWMKSDGNQMRNPAQRDTSPDFGYHIESLGAIAVASLLAIDELASHIQIPELPIGRFLKSNSLGGNQVFIGR